MDYVIRHDRKRVLIAAAACVLLLPPSINMHAQSAVETTLLAKARSLESTGHLDMAAQTWEQVLLVDANSKEALLGLAKADMRLGKTQEARGYLNRLRAAGGSAADIASVEAMSNMQPQAVRLKQAAQLSQQGKYADALRIYRDIFGSNPPAGDYALSYYDTEAAIPAERAHAIVGLRQLTRQFPADSRYAVTLGRVLTYDPQTRQEGIAILSQYESVPAAKSALQQAQVWNTKPSAAVTAGQGPVAPVAPVPPGPEQLAYRALNSGRIDEAKRIFQNILDRQPNNRDALAGMGYVAMKQQDFSTAADYFERASAAGNRSVSTALNSAQFWIKMNAAEEQLKAGNSDAAAEGYRAALQLDSNNPNAFEGLGGAMMQAGREQDAIPFFEQAVRADAQRASAWKGLFMAQSAADDMQAALDTNARIPKKVLMQLQTDPDYLHTLAQDYLATGKKTDADRVVAQALSLPFPNEGRDLTVPQQLQYAGLLMTAKKYDPAIRLYQQVLEKAPDNSDAWTALIAAQHQMNADDAALATIGRMPQAVFEKEQNNAPFLALVGSIYQSRRDFAHAQKYLERASSLTPSQAGTTMQLADIYAAQGNGEKAYAIFAREHDRNPTNVQAWRGMLNALHQMNRDRDALRQIAAMPEFVRLRLEEDPSYLQVLASIQSSAGQSQASLKTFDQIAQIYARQNMEEPVDVQIQYGWILLKAKDDRKLYTLISNLANSTSITEQQQTEMNNLWASWSIQRANAALAVGNQSRAIEILTSAAQVFPQDEDVYGALAAAYMKAGQSKQALAIYESRNMDNATPQQFQGAIGAAMAANNLNQARQWLEVALDRFKDNAAILKMAAQYEQARGNSERAAAYYRAALNAAGPAPAGGGLIPQPNDPGATPPAQQLMHLLAPPSSSARLDDMDLPDMEEPADPLQSSPTVPTLADYANGTTPARNQVELAAQTDAPAPPLVPDALDARMARTARPAPAPPTWKPPLRSTPIDLDAYEAPSVDLKPVPAPAAPSIQSRRVPEARTAIYTNASTLAALPEAHRLTPEPLMAQSYIPSDPAQLPAQQQQQQPPLSPAPASPQRPRTTIPPLDAEPQELPPLSLPPLSGTNPRTVRPKTEREQIEEQLKILEGASSDWVGASGVADYRSGQPGYDQLAIFSMPMEASFSLSPNVRTTFVAKPVLLDAGVATDQTTLLMGTNDPLADPPRPQTASGIGGEVQLRTPSFAAMLGYSPYGFLVQNVIGGLYIHPPSSHLTLTFGRDSIMDTQLSYSGLRDLNSRSATYVGNYWGGVIATSGEMQLSFGNERAGWYAQGGGQYITGRHVLSNKRIDGDAGAYWAVWQRPDIGNLTLGLNFFGMHYDHNLRYFTYGHGGYFSPQAYMLAGIPFTFNGHRGTQFHYRVTGSLGVQAFEEDDTQYYPLDPVLQGARKDPWYPSQTNVGGNYSLNAEGSYAIAEHWYVGGYLNFNNSRNYASNNVGFYVRYLFKPQPEGVDNGPTGIYPVQGMRPLHVP